MKKNIVFSGIQPTGKIHLGNYVGAIKNWVKLSHQINDFKCYFCIVDYHAITMPYDVKNLNNNSWEVIFDLLACGLNIEHTRLFIQSQVPQHTELFWLFNTLVAIGSLQRMTQFKDKSKQQQLVYSGLLNYPILQSADIALYKTDTVPVGEDQLQHLELTREIIRHFNYRFGNTFPEPKAMISKSARIIGLDGKSKMSKSLNNHIEIDEPYESFSKKIKKAVTDENRKRRSDPGNPDVCNIFQLHKIFSSVIQQSEIDTSCRGAKIGCVDCKQILIDNLEKVIAPIREKKQILRQNTKQQQMIKQQILEHGQECKKEAQKTIHEVRQKMGFIP